MTIVVFGQKFHDPRWKSSTDRSQVATCWLRNPVLDGFDKKVENNVLEKWIKNPAYFFKPCD